MCNADRCGHGSESVYPTFRVMIQSIMVSTLQLNIIDDHSRNPINPSVVSDRARHLESKQDSNESHAVDTVDSIKKSSLTSSHGHLNISDINDDHNPGPERPRGERSVKSRDVRCGCVPDSRPTHSISMLCTEKGVAVRSTIRMRMFAGFSDGRHSRSPGRVQTYLTLDGSSPRSSTNLSALALLLR